MRKNDRAARGTPLAALLLILALALGSGAVLGESILEVHQTLDPDEIFVAQFGEDPGTAELLLSLESTGDLLRYPIDLVFVVDTSATSDLAQAKQFAFDVIDRLAPDDRIAVVSYATTATLVSRLTVNRTEARMAIADLILGGKSALGAGLQLARAELQENGREDALLIEILLGDGQSNVGIEPEMEGRVAADMGIMINSVGLGPLINRGLLETFAEESGGLFFERPTDRARFDLLDQMVVDVAARQVEVQKRLPEGLRLVSATPNPVSIETNDDGVTTATWRLGTLMRGRDTAIEMVIEAVKRGTWKTDIGSTVRFEDFRGVETVLSIPALDLDVVESNQAPIAVFDYEPKNPTTLDKIEFEDLSVDAEEEGRVVAWAWDFDDGATSEEQDPTHRFEAAGTYMLQLVVTDDRGLASEVYEIDIEVDEGPRVEATRTIETCLPDDLTIPGTTIDVILSIAVNTTVNGLAVTEIIPDGWTFIEGQNDGATIRTVGQTVEWLFLEMLVLDEVNSQREIRYSLGAPTTLSDGDVEQASLQGLIGSSSPRFAQAMLGEDKLTMTRFLPLPVVISQWNAEVGELQLCEGEPGIIDFREIQYAISLWLSGGVVPETNNETIDLGVMQDLIAYWLTGSSVHDPLP